MSVVSQSCPAWIEKLARVMLCWCIYLDKRRTPSRITPTDLDGAESFPRPRGMLRTRDALEAGINPRTVYSLRDSGRIEQLSRGLFRFAEALSLGNPDLVTVAIKIPQRNALPDLCARLARTHHPASPQNLCRYSPRDGAVMTFLSTGATLLVQRKGLY